MSSWEGIGSRRRISSQLIYPVHYTIACDSIRPFDWMIQPDRQVEATVWFVAGPGSSNAYDD